MLLLLSALLFFTYNTHTAKFYTLTAPSTGFFSCFHMVVGFLHFYEKNKARCSGIKVNFDEGLYFDVSRGNNWWNYYFEPLYRGNETGSESGFISAEQRGNWAAETGFPQNLHRSHRIIKTYITVKPHIQKLVQNYYERNFKNYFMIGIHYRGTDKVTEVPLVPYEFVGQRLQAIIQRVGTKPYKIFIATDEQQFIEYMALHFDHLVYRDVIRSTNGKTIHYDQPEPYRQGEEALCDCLLLSKCNVLLRTASNLSASALLFNPRIRVFDLTKQYEKAKLKS